MYIHDPVKTYLQQLATRQAVPGGGSAAALVAATGVALYRMAAAYTEPSPALRMIQRRLKSIQQSLERIIDQDATVYVKLREALKSPKARPGRRALVQKRFCAAAAVPLQLAGLCVAALESGTFLAKNGNNNLITDTAAGTLFLESGLTAAALNVRINLKFITRQSFVRSQQQKLAALERRMRVLSRRLKGTIQTKVI